jgi:hypothetical protein
MNTILASPVAILQLPTNIKGINYEAANNAISSLKNIKNKLNINNPKYDINLIINKGLDDEDDDEFERLIPPYLNKCFYCSTKECDKDAAFKYNKNNNYYCWFHIHAILN